MAIKLPLLQAQDPVMNRYQTQLQGSLAPITNNPAAQAIPVMFKDPASGSMSLNISLHASASNSIPIGLSSPLQGWTLTRIKGNAVVWDSQDTNTTPSQTLVLNTSADVVVQLMVW